MDQLAPEAARALLPELPRVITIREIALDEEGQIGTRRTHYAIPPAAQN